MRAFIMAFFLFFICTAVVNGQVPPSSTTTTIMGENTINAVQGAVDKIPAAIPSAILLVITFIIEMLMRFLPTSKPRSIFLLASAMFNLVGTGFLKISTLLDQLVQNIKEPK